MLEDIRSVFKSGKSEKFTGTAYVCFETEQERDDLLEQYEFTSTWQRFKRYMGRHSEIPQMKIMGEEVVIE